MTKVSHTESLTRLIELLEPLESGDRQRLVRSALTFLGESGGGASSAIEQLEDDGAANIAISPRSRTWLKQNNLSGEQLQQVFHIGDGKAEVIASEIPGSSAKERTVNAYVLAGLAKYLASGDMKFDDKSARAVCSTLGSYDNTNHATYLKSRGNLFAGSKDAGWSLTAPGLKHGADLVKVITRSDQ